MSRDSAEKLQNAFDCFNAHDLNGTERLCRELLAKEPRNAEALHLLGVSRLMSGNAREAVTLIEKALKRAPGIPLFIESLGLAHLASHDFQQAEILFRRAIKLGQTHGLSHMRLGLALEAQGKAPEAEAAFAAASAASPNEPDIHVNFGNFLAKQRHGEKALECYRKALELWPECLDAHYAMGTLLMFAERLEEAAAAFHRALSLDPDYLDATHNLGIVYEMSGQYDDAIACYQRVLALRPDDVRVYTNLASAYRMQGKLKEAAAFCAEALSRKPEFDEALMNLAHIHRLEDRYEESRATYRKMLSVNPDNVDALHDYGMLCLALGRFEEGLPGYQYRRARQRMLAQGVVVDSFLPGDLDGKTVLLLAEQGIGDEIFFVRFVPFLRARGARVVCQCTPKAKSVLQRAEALDLVVGLDEPVPARDVTVMMGDLASLLYHPANGLPGWSAHQIPVPLALRPLDDRLASVGARLAALGPPPYVGVTWRAGWPVELQRGKRDLALDKRVPLDLLAPVLRDLPGTLLSIQRNPRPTELAFLRRTVQRDVHDLSLANDDLEDMIAILMLLDEYVGVSNTNVHLMASVGRRARVLVTYPPWWQWMVSGGQSPWFPGFSLYRQAPHGDWEAALTGLAHDLKKALMPGVRAS